MNFQDKLDAIITKNNSLVCVGLDSDSNKLPEHIKQEEHPQFVFNKAIIDATHDFVCAYKPNSAFYEATGAKGVEELKITFDYINATYPEIVTILDAKRGDIGNTNEGYAQYVFDYLQADAITVMPYMGIESLSSYFIREGKGVIVGCHSSNPGAVEFQETYVVAPQGHLLRGSGANETNKSQPLYKQVAIELMKQHGNNPNCMIFMGATYPKQLKEIRAIVGNMTFLVPGVGAQEGAVEKAVKAGLNNKKAGMIINSSRGIIFASSGTDFAEKAKEETIKLQQAINQYR